MDGRVNKSTPLRRPFLRTSLGPLIISGHFPARGGSMPWSPRRGPPPPPPDYKNGSIPSTLSLPREPARPTQEAPGSPEVAKVDRAAYSLPPRARVAETLLSAPAPASLSTVGHSWDMVDWMFGLIHRVPHRLETGGVDGEKIRWRVVALERKFRPSGSVPDTSFLYRGRCETRGVFGQ